VSPPECVREVLADHKRAGVSFDLAWARALRQLRGHGAVARWWREALEWAKPAFEAAYADVGSFPLAGVGIELAD